MARSFMAKLLTAVVVGSCWLGVFGVVEMEVLWPNIQRTGTWTDIADASCPRGITTDGSASLTFVGTEVKLWIPWSPTGVQKIRLNLDGRAQDVNHNGTILNCGRWWRYRDLVYKEHTVSVGFVPGTENSGRYLNFVKFTYLTLEESERASLASVSSTSALTRSVSRSSAISIISTASLTRASTASLASTSEGIPTSIPEGESDDPNINSVVQTKSNIGGIVGGIVGGILGSVIVLILAIVLWKRRKNHSANNRPTIDLDGGNEEKRTAGIVADGPPTLSHMSGSDVSGIYAYGRLPAGQQTAFGVYPDYASQNPNSPTTTIPSPSSPRRSLSSQPSTWSPVQGQPGHYPQYSNVEQFRQPMQAAAAYSQEFAQGSNSTQPPVILQQPPNPLTHGMKGVGIVPALAQSQGTAASSSSPPPSYAGHSSSRAFK